MTVQRWLFAASVFVASFLLFLVEPIAARQLLPVLGGSAAVWITCLAFFQSALLLGYLYAHLLARWQSQALHVGLITAGAVSAALWVTRSFTGSRGATHPVTTVFVDLGGSIGLPFILLAATSPLLQVWWARLETGQIPYRLYALSNLASLLALAAYPTLVEPNLTLHSQRILWCCGYGIFAVICILLAIKSNSVKTPLPQSALVDGPAERRAPLLNKVFWFVLPMGAAMQLSAITAYLTANVVAIPLLWILPLGVYLITLILPFQFRVALPWRIIARFMVVLLAALAYSISKRNASWPLWLLILFFLVELFFACIFCHSAAIDVRPKRASEATLFYLLFAAGGASGAFLIGVAAPLLSNINLDLPITFLAMALLLLAVNWRGTWNERLLWIVASCAMVVLVFMVRHVMVHDAIVTVRNFYASLRVTEDPFSYPGTKIRTLMNGSIQHGTQIFGIDELRTTPTTYYSEDSGVGVAIRFCCSTDGHDPRPRIIGVIGLGAGTIAALGRRGDRIRFYEINPAVIPIARNAFSYIRDSQARIDIIEGDARTSLGSEDPQNFDVLAIDAFSGDSIPIHLLTREALVLYRRHLAPGGILAFHISNRHVNLEPPLAVLASSVGMEARRVDSRGDHSPGEYASTWILFTDNVAFFSRPELLGRAVFPVTKPGLRVWTDDYSALLPVLRW
jgi:SAM-dependent methyltransferase